MTLSNRPLPRPLLLCAMAFLICVGAVACSSRPSAQESLDDLHISDSPKVVVATAVELVGPAAILGPDLTDDYLQVKFALRGFSWADAGCAVDRIRSMVTSDRLDSMPLGRIDDLAYDYPQLDADSRTCASPESLARLDAKAATTTTVAGQPPATAATDIDGATVRTMLQGFYAVNAKALGLTSAERTCMFDAAVGKRSDADMVKLILGLIPSGVDASASKVVGCLTGDRMDVITPKAAKELLARQDAKKAEHARVQAVIDARLAPTTTVPPVGG